ncbi:hypothetical protein MASR2M47_07540 [Draconibacterium sp.]
MKNKIIVKCCLVVISLFLVFSCYAEVKNIKLYVSTEGNDQNPGTINAPFQTLEKARDAVRLLRRSSPDQAVTVYIHNGVYPIENGLKFSPEDSGNEKAPVIYQAMEGETPVFRGSKPLKNWELLKDETKLNLLNASVRKKVYVSDLKLAGISDFGDPIEIGKRPELFCNSQLQTLARWPNKGFVKAGLVKGETELPPNYTKVRGTREGIFQYTDSHQNGWKNENEVCLGGYWYWDWSDEFQKVKTIDSDNMILSLQEPYHNYGYKDSLRYFALNLFCELDEPGEYYLDRTNGNLYWFPPNEIDPNQAEVRLSVCSTPYMVELDHCSYFTIQGLSFEESRGSAILVNGGSHCLIKDCRLERFGKDGIHLIDGSENGIAGCLLRTFGCGGIQVKGGDRKTLTPANHFVEHTVVEDFSLFKRTYQPAVHVDGCGIRISNNSFKNSSSSAMRLEGNDILIEYNEVSRVVNESDDQGGVDIFYNPSYRGIVIRYNRWSDISGGTRHGAAGVRLDDMISSVSIYGNLFERCGVLGFGAIQIHGGKDNLVENNLFYNCFAAVSCTSWGEKRWLQTLDNPVIQKKIYEDVDISSPVYLKKYPDLKDIRRNADRNTVTNNLMVDCQNMFLRKNKALIVANNDSINSNGKPTAALCDPSFLKKYGLKPIPYNKMGPKKNLWLNEK